MNPMVVHIAQVGRGSPCVCVTRKSKASSDKMMSG